MFEILEHLPYLIKQVCFSLIGNFLRQTGNLNITAVVLILIICKDLRNWYNVWVNFSYFTVFLKNRNISSKIKRSKVTDYAALKVRFLLPFEP